MSEVIVIDEAPEIFADAMIHVRWYGQFAFLTFFTHRPDAGSLVHQQPVLNVHAVARLVLPLEHLDALRDTLARIRPPNPPATPSPDEPEKNPKSENIIDFKR